MINYTESTSSYVKTIKTYVKIDTSNACNQGPLIQWARAPELQGGPSY